MSDTWVTMSHPDVSSTATVTVAAFAAVWEPLGWIEAGGLVGPGADSSVLKEWVESEAYSITAIIYLVAHPTVIDTADVVWPDGSPGEFETTTVNDTWEATDAFTITHEGSGKTVTQAAVTRNASGLVTVKPALVVS